MRTIDADVLKRKVQRLATEAWKMQVKASVDTILNQFIDYIDHAPTVDTVLVVRCKDCKHRPTGSNRDDLEFPDDKCPCQCEDFWYNWKPTDEWYCGNGERKDGEVDG